jgi:hypothetical protein
MLAYEPRVPLETGLERMYQYYLANPVAEDN